MAAVTDHDIARDGLEPKFPHLEPRLSITETRPCSTHAQKYMTLPQPASEEADTTRPSSGFIARLRPRSPYFSLFRCLDTATDKIILALGVILAIAAGAPLPIIGLLFSQIIDSFPPPEDELNAKLYELIGVACVYFVLSWGWCVCWGLVGQRIARNRRETLVSSVLGLDMATYDVSAPDVATSLTTDCQTILLGTSEKVGLFIQSISYFVSTICVGFALNAKLTSILLAAVVPSMSVIVFCGASITSKWSKRASMLAENAAKIAEEAIGATKLIQAYDVAAIFIKSHDELMTRHVSAGLRKSIASASMLGSVYFVCYSTNALAFFAGNKLQPEGGAGKIYAITFLLLDATFVIGQVGPFIQTLTLAGAAAKRINNLVESSSAIDVYSGAGIVVTKEHFQGDIMVKDLSFRYPARPDVDVLNNVSMDFGPGSFTALLGLSGSGKSTIASLLLRLYDSDHGCIKLAGVDLKHYNVSSLRSHIAVVDQNSVLFRGSILQNIAQGIPKVANLTDDGVLRECERAASEASCDFIPDLVNGIHTTIGGEDGVELSGGQRQRISLARALARRPALLILDEPTASLDSTSEAFVIDALKRVIKSGMTVIMVTHRLASISHADNIVVMESGIIVEQGDHDHLAQQDGLYAKLLSTQQSRHGSNIPGDDRPTSSDSEKTLVAMTPKVAAEVKASKADVGNALAANDSGTLSRSTTSVVRRIWTLSRPERPLILLGTIASLLTGALIIGEAFIFGHLVAALNAEIPDRAIIHLYCLMFFVLGLIALIAYTTSGSSFGYVSERLAGRVQHLSLECTLDQDQAFFNSPKCRNIHELAASISGDCAALTGLSGVIIGTICSVLVSMFGGLILALIVAWKIAVVLLAVVPIMFLACWLRLHTAAAFEKRHKSAYGGGAAIAMEACKGIRTVAAYGLEHDVLKRYEDTVKKPYEEGTKMILLGNIILAMSYSITYFVYALAYWWGATQVRDGGYSQLQFFIVLPALLFSAQTSGQFFSMSPEISRAKVAANSIFDLLDSKPSILNNQAKTTNDMSRLSESKTSVVGASVTLANARFTYPNQSSSTLDDINLTLPPNTFTAIVGPSGSGKSSLLALLQRFYDTTSGSIFLNDLRITELPVQAYRSRISLVPQEPTLFSGTIAFNVSLGAAPNTARPSHAQIEAVCKEVGIHDFIASLPQGYDTPCGDGGNQLSGGQKQRIALARALIRQPEILLLDECTASLDAQSEREVLDAVNRARKERNMMIVMVTHRLGAVVDADSIVVLENGRIAEKGVHGDLMTNEGLYWKMATEQGLV